MNKAPDAFRTISEVADELDLPQHVLRFWESRFPHIKPLKRGGGRRYYRPEDIDLLRGIRRLLYADGYTIRGVQRILREQGVRIVQAVGQGLEVPNLAIPPEDGGEDGRNGNGALAQVSFLTPPRPPDDAEDDGAGPEANAQARPQNSPIAEANVAVIHPVTVAPVAGLEAGQAVDQASGAVVPAVATSAVATSVGVTQIAAAPLTAAPAGAAPVAITMPSPSNMAVRDLDRLKQALAELEACRRLLDKAIEGGR